MLRSWRALPRCAIALLAIVLGLAIAAGPATPVAVGTAMPSVAPYAYDPLPASTTPGFNSGSDAPPVGLAPAGGSRSSTSLIALSLAAKAGSEVVDVAARRVTLRAGTKAEIREAAPKTASGDFIDPNTGQIMSKNGPFDYGHKPGFEWWRTQQRARQEGWSRRELIEYENDPTHYRIEAPGPNRSRRYEAP